MRHNCARSGMNCNVKQKTSDLPHLTAGLETGTSRGGELLLVAIARLLHRSLDI